MRTKKRRKLVRTARSPIQGYGVFAKVCIPKGTYISYGWTTATGYNHSCEPNVVRKPNDAFTCTIAARDIEAGEELTIGYLDGCRPPRCNCTPCRVKRAPDAR